MRIRVGTTVPEGLIGILFRRRITLTVLSIACAFLSSPVHAKTARDKLLSAKRAAYDANFKNDQRGLRKCIEQFDALASDQSVAAYALYYAGWTRWGLSASQWVAKDTPGALATLDRAAEDSRKALSLRPDDVEFQTMLLNTLISTASLDMSKFQSSMTEIRKLRQQVLGTAPQNPRVVMMDAGMIFNTPAQYGGSQEKGIARWLEAIRLFEAEKFSDRIVPDWGQGLAQGWLASLYLRTTPPNLDEARKMANRALALRKDFWWVKTQVLPKTAASK
ncbi:MAG: hypothetical protein HY046_13575 [Acidobacteria bacterium]|nr:hypothetical protein [Acidobacteriota bacterium]